MPSMIDQERLSNTLWVEMASISGWRKETQVLNSEAGNWDSEVCHHIRSLRFVNIT